jgi:flagellar motility protein MotE (MotC chaperone)
VSVLEKRESYLKELEDAIEAKVRALEDEKVLFQQSLQREKEVSEERLTNLVEYYKKMDAKKAAGYFTPEGAPDAAELKKKKGRDL